MELAQQVPPTLASQYQARFGDAGAFDTTLLPESATLSLMAEALRRDQPVTAEDLTAMHWTIYSQPPNEGQPVHPSGAGVPIVPPPAEWPPAYYLEVPPPPEIPPVAAAAMPSAEAHRDAEA
jgi:hypothetical protein